MVLKHLTTFLKEDVGAVEMVICWLLNCVVLMADWRLNYALCCGDVLMAKIIISNY